jgi:dTDP-6-deoxy-L-talose 4-dehydrogenase (NAD+)
VRALVTGATGHVGLAVLKALGALGEADIIGLARHVNRKSDAAPLPGNVRMYQCDLLNSPVSGYRALLKDVDVVFHLAWYTEVSDYRSSIQNLAWLSASKSLAGAAEASGVSQFVAAGSGDELEASNWPISADAPLKPSSFYGLCKSLLCLYLENMSSRGNLNIAWCRLFHVFGEGESPGRLTAQIERCRESLRLFEARTPDNVIDVTPVEEVAARLVHVALNCLRGRFNISIGHAVTVQSHADQVMSGHYGVPDHQGLSGRFPRPAVVGSPSFPLGTRF